MTILYVNTGTSPNKGDGDSLRVSFDKINQNFRELITSISTATTSTASIQVGAMAPTDPAIGSLWYDVITGRLYVWYDNYWVDTNPDAVAGPTGPRGNPGPEGIQGLNGPTGPSGPRGAASNVSGPQGVSGPTGPQGPTGPPGLGNPGHSGPSGPSGPRGLSGPQGNQGADGIQGVNGPSGPSGPFGLSGPTGPQGVSGPSGPIFAGGSLTNPVNIDLDIQSVSTITGALTVLGGVGIGKNLTVGQRLSFAQTEESFTTLNGAMGVVEHDCSAGMIFNHIGITANFTVNLTNLNLDPGFATTVSCILNQGNTPYVSNALQIAGVTQLVRWQGNSIAPSGSPNKKEVVSFSIYNVSGSYTVLGQLVSFG
jgi:hypothetical protein